MDDELMIQLRAAAATPNPATIDPRIAEEAASRIATLTEALEDAVNTLEAMDLYAGNPLYNRLVAVLEANGQLTER